MRDDFDRFGTSEENIRSAQKWATKHRKQYTYHTHVPTRKEVASFPAERLERVLVGRMTHSATEIIPGRVQIALVRDQLRDRADVAKLTSLIAMCKHYIDGS